MGRAISHFMDPRSAILEVSESEQSPREMNEKTWTRIERIMNSQDRE
jgi:hypothetical protein